jgi:hypothetical protein
MIGAEQRAPEGWFLAGSDPQDYEVGVDRQEAHGGQASGFIRAITDTPKGFGTLMQIFRADTYRGKRLRMTGLVKAERIADWAGLWMRVDGPGGTLLSFDNMQSRPIRGTSDWSLYQIVLDVPTTSLQIAFGVLLRGAGRAWVDDFAFEVVGADVPMTGAGASATLPAEPRNLNFEG